ncbi:MAG: hypothetical protein COW01_12925 [Bdellovibrionales bacterium CG12_big_fil_rev_8_21_14_0_65_38_15]|nr:MAG: hypothetical protein COW79_08695 [Bdellovibrionales bacterium CG22_combo_CG10-13_8_21_14_all_38_13]PIQ53526.1 MAG: hypothetical protein COW01_12925 [Bdellovibrionales bacterium CG12_big_fil_rev_8_21_14_0_65_38_15]PIR28470.1 MAG: hypothetical protein COV38_15715 [Bdellovibrionales bacterium CG11_big_fil_rev_8_21_14_0_20_38_13]
MKVLFLVTLLFSFGQLHAEQIDVNEKLYLYKVYRQQTKKFTQHKTIDLRRELVNRSGDLSLLLLFRLDKIIPSPFIDSIAYHIFIDSKEEKLEEALSYLMLNRFLVVKQNAEKSSASAEAKERAGALLTKWSNLEKWDETSTRFMLELIQRRASLISQIGSAQAIIEAIESTPIIADRLDVEIGLKSALLPEPIGEIPGNIVSLFFKNDRSLAKATKLKELKDLPAEDESRKTMVAQLASESLVKPLFEMINSSKENLIIVSPEMAGLSEDAFLAALKVKLEETEDWKVIYVGLGSISPRLLSLSNQFKSRFAIMAIPDEAVKDGSLSWQTFIPSPDSKYGTQHGLGLMAVTDSASTTPHAFISSRRFIDHPHAYSFEQSLVIQGPAAGLLPQLLNENLKQLVPSYSDLSTYFPSRTHYPTHGQESVNLTVDSARLAARDDRALAVKFLIGTKEEILIDQYMLYDRAIVDSIIKLKIKNPDLKVKILLDTNLDLEMNGLPNAIFLKEMKMYGIELKARKSLHWEEADSEDSIVQFHAINHRNLMIRDRKSVFMGTGPFMGSFERRSPISFGIQLNTTMSSELADSFIDDWENVDTTYELDVENFEAKIGKRHLSHKVSSFLNTVFSVLLRAFD